jgi:hypothetical protein
MQYYIKQTDIACLQIAVRDVMSTSVAEGACKQVMQVERSLPASLCNLMLHTSARSSAQYATQLQVGPKSKLHHADLRHISILPACPLLDECCTPAGGSTPQKKTWYQSTL